MIRLLIYMPLNRRVDTCSVIYSGLILAFQTLPIFFIFVYNQFIMNSPEVKAFIRKHSALFWYIPEDKKEDIDEEVLVEFILNYGTLEDIKELLKILGTKNVANIFFNVEGRKKLNYYPEIYNYFSLFFKKYV